jgi:hypothetical protein
VFGPNSADLVIGGKFSARALGAGKSNRRFIPGGQDYAGGVFITGKHEDRAGNVVLRGLVKALHGGEGLLKKFGHFSIVS